MKSWLLKKGYDNRFLEAQIARASCIPRSGALTTKTRSTVLSLIQCPWFWTFILQFLNGVNNITPKLGSE